MQALGLPTLVAAVRSNVINANSQKRNKQTHEKDHGEGSDSTYIPRAKEGQERKMEVILLA